MGISKVNYGDETLIDLTSDTVTPETLAEGTTAHDAAGNPIAGTMASTAVLYTEQTLTEAQKSQAIANIGAAASTHTHSGYAASSHKHSAGDITSGTLAVARGGTGVTTNPSMLVNLAGTAAASVFAASPRPGVTGTLPISKGGTGATTAEAARAALGISGGVQMATGSYSGTGSSKTLTFSFSPKLIFVSAYYYDRDYDDGYGNVRYCGVAFDGISPYTIHGSISFSASFSGNSVTLSSQRYEISASGRTHYYIAFG